jgi:hypothetical protein
MKQPTHTKPDLPIGDPEQRVHHTAAKKCTDSTSSKIPTPQPCLPYENIPTKLMEALCGKESEHW